MKRLDQRYLVIYVPVRLVLKSGEVLESRQ